METFELENEVRNRGGSFRLDRATFTGNGTKKSLILLTVPYYLYIEAASIKSWEWCVDRGGPHQVERVMAGNAFLAWNFNNMWCFALNRQPRPDYFAMVHVDVVITTLNWLDIMVAELSRAKADLLSVVLPIKDQRGLSSTCVENKKTGGYRRLTMTELGRINSQTFDAPAAGFPDCRLLASTGLWIADFRKPWVEKVHFQVQDRIVKREDGTFLADSLPEDWDFSRQLHRLGCKVVASKCVAATHEGHASYPNNQVWGSLEHDEEVIPASWG